MKKIQESEIEPNEAKEDSIIEAKKKFTLSPRTISVIRKNDYY